MNIFERLLVKLGLKKEKKRSQLKVEPGDWKNRVAAALQSAEAKTGYRHRGTFVVRVVSGARDEWSRSLGRPVGVLANGNCGQVTVYTRDRQEAEIAMSRAGEIPGEILEHECGHAIEAANGLGEGLVHCREFRGKLWKWE